MFSSVDLVRFTWLIKHDDQSEGEDDRDDKDEKGTQDDDKELNSAENGTRYTTPPTVWIGVALDTLAAGVAHESATEILELLEKHNITGVDVAYRESLAKLARGPALFGPAADLDPLKDVIDNVSTSLSLPIAGWTTRTQGTLGFYFKVGNELFAATARHVLFRDNEGNSEYKYIGAFYFPWR